VIDQDNGTHDGFGAACIFAPTVGGFVLVFGLVPGEYPQASSTPRGVYKLVVQSATD
jgi:hypothetical protein